MTFACVNFGQKNNIHYEYSLGDGSEPWQNIGNSGEMTFANLPHGDYQFNVRAVTNDGSIIGKTSTLFFTIRPAHSIMRQALPGVIPPSALRSE